MLQGNRFLVTISQTGEFDFEIVKQKLLEKYKDISYCCISREKHVNKGWHCHIFLQFTKRKKFVLTEKYNPFTFLFDKPADVEKILKSKKDRINVLCYVKKAQDYIEFGYKDIDESMREIVNIEQYVIKAIKEGVRLDRLLTHEIEKIQDYAYKHSRQIKQMIYERDNLIHQKELEKLKGIEKIDEGKLRKEYRTIAKILNEARNDRSHKSVNLHIWSREPNMGKTSLVEQIMSFSPCYIFPTDGWFTRYNNYIYHFIIWDEVNFKNLQPTFLNLFLEGSKCQMPVKGDLTHKWDNPLVIMLSNKPIREHLEKITNERDREIYIKTLGVRVKEIELSRPLFKFIKLIKARSTEQMSL
jgi:hypothetical protein